MATSVQVKVYAWRESAWWCLRREVKLVVIIIIWVFFSTHNKINRCSLGWMWSEAGLYLISTSESENHNWMDTFKRESASFHSLEVSKCDNCRWCQKPVFSSYWSIIASSVFCYMLNGGSYLLIKAGPHKRELLRKSSCLIGLWSHAGF